MLFEEIFASSKSASLPLKATFAVLLSAAASAVAVFSPFSLLPSPTFSSLVALPFSRVTLNFRPGGRAWPDLRPGTHWLSRFRPFSARTALRPAESQNCRSRQRVKRTYLCCVEICFHENNFFSHLCTHEVKYRSQASFYLQYCSKMTPYSTANCVKRITMILRKAFDI